MHFIVAYDIALPRRLRRVARICSDYGQRLQKSVFECDMERTFFDEMWRRLEAELDGKEDRLVAYPLCAGCAAQRVTAGQCAETDATPLAVVC